ncbi:MAG: hypothetical protein ACI8XO_004473, partial [Verrucomicrobiales bacterium]
TICWLFWPSPALASNSNSPLSSLKSALVLAKIPAYLCMTYFLTTPKTSFHPTPPRMSLKETAVDLRALYHFIGIFTYRSPL